MCRCKHFIQSIEMSHKYTQKEYGSSVATGCNHMESVTQTQTNTSMYVLKRCLVFLLTHRFWCRLLLSLLVSCCYNPSTIQWTLLLVCRRLWPFHNLCCKVYHFARAIHSGALSLSCLLAFSLHLCTIRALCFSLAYSLGFCSSNNRRLQ